MNDVKEYGFPPSREVSEDGETIGIDYKGFRAEVWLSEPFGPDLVVGLPLQGAHIESLPGHGLIVEATLDAEKAERLWSVLTMAINELDPGYCANRLRQIEGEEVARQEKGQ